MLVMDGMMTGLGGWGLVISLTVVFLLVLAVLGGVSLYPRLRGPRADRIARTGGEGDPALRRLRRRFADGEIDEQEFETRLSALTHWR